MSLEIPQAAGFVLAGGRSLRMGRDKALLPIASSTLLERIVAEVRRAAGNVTVIADPSRYAGLGVTVIPDQRPGLGPLGGVVTALGVTGQDWNLVVACDMPDVEHTLLNKLLAEAGAAAAGTECVVPLGPSGREPLCAVYHRRATPKLRDALDRNILKMRTVLESLQLHEVDVPDARRRFRNINTPEDWDAHGAAVSPLH